MHLRISLFAIALLLCLSFASLLDAHMTTVATTGADAAGIPATSWNAMETITINNAGDLLFTATLQHDGNINADNDTGVWLLDGTGQTLLARTGVGNVPALSSAVFETFERAAISDSGGVALSGILVADANGITTENNRGIWRYDSTDDSLEVRTGSGNVPGIPNASFTGFPDTIEFSLAADGQFAVRGRLALGVGGVLTSNDRGLWSFPPNSSTPSSKLVAREGSFGVPGVPNASFNTFELPAINSNNQLAVSASLNVGGSVTPANARGLWLFSDSSAELFVRTGSTNVPGVVGASFAKIRTPLLNDLGQVAFMATISTGSSGGAISTGVWRYDNTSENLLALTGVGNVPGVPGTNFHSFSSTSSLDNSGQVLTHASLGIGVGGVTSDNHIGLWLLGDNPALIARRGVASVPEILEANFSQFFESALNEQGQVAFSAGLELGVSGVDTTNDGGIWIVDPIGDSWLVAREGDLLAGQTIASLDFVADSAGQSGGFNDAGELAFHATFTNGNSGLFLFRPYAADFDRDGEVDADDLAEWETAFAAMLAADADSDGDTDGADFLVWQREFGSGAGVMPIITKVVPEPASWLLLSLAGLFSSRYKCCRR